GISQRSIENFQKLIFRLPYVPSKSNLFSHQSSGDQPAGRPGHESGLLGISNPSALYRRVKFPISPLRINVAGCGFATPKRFLMICPCSRRIPLNSVIGSCDSHKSCSKTACSGCISHPFTTSFQSVLPCFFRPFG